MTGVRISALPPIVTPTSTDFFPVVQSGVTQKETMAQLVSFLGTSAFVPLSGGTMTGPLILSGNASAPLQAATYQQVQVAASGLTVILSTQAGTTANLNATYANGTAGVGATLTNAGTQAAFAVDGYSASLNDRILVKNQTSTFANGVYSVTTIGTGVTNWVLTRTTDYNTAPSEIKPGTLISVTNGSTQAGTSWLESATVNTVGTDPIVFSQFTFAPGSYLQRANNLSDVASVPTSLVNLTLGTPTGTGNVVRQTSPSIILPSILDASSNNILTFTSNPSPVNYLSMYNAATGNFPAITAHGSDPNVGIVLQTQGTGPINLLSGSAYLAQFNAATSSDVNYVSFSATATTVSPSISAVGTDPNINLLLSGKGTGGVQSKGTTNGVASSSGYVGELISSTVLAGSAVPIATGTNVNVTSVALSAGCWLVFANAGFVMGAATQVAAGFNTSSTSLTGADAANSASITALISNGTGFVVPIRQYNVTTATTIYLVSYAVYSGSTISVYGALYALRIR